MIELGTSTLANDNPPLLAHGGVLGMRNIEVSLWVLFGLIFMFYEFYWLDL